MERNTLVGVDFLVMGATISSLGFFLAESVSIASFGFALLVIGAIILLVVPEPVPQDALKALLKDSIRNVESILEESGLRTRAYFMKMSDGELRALVPLSDQGSGNAFPEMKDFDSIPRRFVVDDFDVRGLLVIPPGNELVRLAKVEQGGNLEEALRSTLVEYSDLARGVLAIEEDEGRLVKVQINKPQLSSESPYFNDSLGTPVSCVALCVAAVVKGVPVRIRDERYDPSFIRLTIEASRGS